ncbi:MAG: hypothetical protein ACM3TN_04500, partial [Alphaproteobacteria bacterium]
PQRLQIEARWLVVRTGTFLNIVAINIFIVCSLKSFVVPCKVQWGCQIHRKKKLSINQPVNG